MPLDYSTIQSAINAAVNGDTVLVAPGTYAGSINFSGKAITVVSESGPEATLIDAGRLDSAVKFISGEGRASVLQGFSVINGRAPNALPSLGKGGGVLVKNASPTIRGNLIANNEACTGVGISVEFGAPLIERNTIANNRRFGCTGGTGGGGINVTNDATPRPATEILDNVVSGNIMNSGDGGGIWVGSNVVIRGNIITGNSATGSSPCGRGGGISAAGSTLIVQNVVARNTAGCGGGIYLLNTAAGQLVASNTIVDNDGSQGSGIYLQATLPGAPPQPTNNLIVAKAAQSAVNCSLANGASAPVLRFSNVFGSAAALYAGNCTSQTGLNGNISADPMFADAARMNYRLLAGSPSLDAGDNAALQLPSRDLDGNARVLTVVDQGAYERTPLLAPASLDLGPAEMGGGQLAGALRVSNSGSETLLVSSISVAERAVGAGGPGGFAVATGGTDPCPSLAPTLAAGESCTVEVTFTPPATPGTRGASLRIASNLPGSPAAAALLADVVVDTSITASVPDRTSRTTVSFSFASNGDGTTFECWLDARGDFFPCTSPQSFSGLGTGTHTFMVRAISKFGDRDPTAAVRTWTVARRTRYADFSGDGISDILWRNRVSGENYVYFMFGRLVGGEGYLRTVADQDWRVTGIGDFDFDGKADILWRNASTGENYIYLMNNLAIAGEGPVRTVADQNWTVVGVGDFDGDDKADILWRNSSTGENYVYLMDGTAIAGEGYLRTVADPSWSVAGVGDFNGDGKSDILWRNSSTGENYLYLMNGTTIVSEGYIRTVADPSWHVAGVGDFDGDGRSDLLWRNSSTGENYIYFMNGVAIAYEGYIRTVADQNWQVAGTGDFTGDGMNDILWRNGSSGENYLYPMDGTTIKPIEGYVRSVAPPDWQIQNP